MKLAIIGSRSLRMDRLQDYLPEGITEIVSGGARGIDRDAMMFAEANGIPVTVFLPEYERYGKSAPLKRNEQIVQYADAAIAFWDGRSRGTQFTVQLFRRYGKPVQVISLDAEEYEFKYYST